MEVKKFSLRLTDELLEKFDEYCESEGQPSRNAAIVNLIEKAVEGETIVTNKEILKQLSEAIQKNNELMDENTALISFMLTTLGQVALTSDIDSKVLSKFEESDIALLQQNNSRPVTKSQFVKQLKDVVNNSVRSSNEIENSNEQAPMLFNVDLSTISNQSKKQESRPYNQNYFGEDLYVRPDELNRIKEVWKSDPYALGNGLNDKEEAITFTKDQYERGEVKELVSYF